MHHDDVKLWIILTKWSLAAGVALLALVGAFRGIAIRNCDHLEGKRLLCFRLLGVLVALAVLGVLAAGAYLILSSGGQ